MYKHVTIINIDYYILYKIYSIESTVNQYLKTILGILVYI